MNKIYVVSGLNANRYMRHVVVVAESTEQAMRAASCITEVHGVREYNMEAGVKTILAGV